MQSLIYPSNFYPKVQGSSFVSYVETKYYEIMVAAYEFYFYEFTVHELSYL